MIDTGEVIGNDEEPVARRALRARGLDRPRRRRRRRGRLRRARQPRLDRRDDDRGAVRAEADPRRCSGRRSPSQLPRPGRERPAAAARRRRQRRRPRLPPRPVRLSRRRVRRGRARRRASRGSACSRSARRRRRGAPSVVEAHETLARRRRGIDFAGNVEGRDLLDPEADVVVTDGFTGNVVLKTVEGTAQRRRRRGRSRRPVGPGGGRRRAAPAPGARRPARATWTPTRPAARSCSACAGWPSSATAPPAPRGIANQIRLAARAVERAARSSAPRS